MASPFFFISGRFRDSSFRARRMKRTPNDNSGSHSRTLVAMSLLLTLFSVSFAHGQQLTPDQQADMLLSSARRAYNEKNYPFAATRFREFLSKFGNHNEVNSSRYG